MTIVGTEGRAPKEFWGVAGAINSGGESGSGGAGAGHLVPFAVEGLSGAIEVDETPSETTPLVRVWWCFKGQDAARFQGHIAEAAGVGRQFAVKWYDPVAEDWAWLGTDVDGENGPVLAVDATGDLRGRYVNLSPDVINAEEVLLGLFVI